MVLNYNAQAEGQTPDSVVGRLIEHLPLDGSTAAADAKLDKILKH
jgi:hypothetical protein